MSEYFDVIYVSPHPDDVAFSAAAQLQCDIAAGARVAIFTLFDPGGGRLGAFSNGRRRCREDQAYADLAGATRLVGHWLDAGSRSASYVLPAAIFAPLSQAEAPLVDQVRERLQVLVDRGCRRIVAPLGIGEHVDHQIACLASRLLRGCVVHFYEDAPYVFCPFSLARRVARLGLVTPGHDPTLRRHGRVREAWAQSRWLSRTPLLRAAAPLSRLIGATSMAIRSVASAPATHQGTVRAHARIIHGRGIVAVKLAAIDVYSSQWRLFYPDLGAWRAVLERYARTLGHSGAIERTWSLDTGPPEATKAERVDKRRRKPRPTTLVPMKIAATRKRKTQKFLYRACFREVPRPPQARPGSAVDTNCGARYTACWHSAGVSLAKRFAYLLPLCA